MTLDEFKTKTFMVLEEYEESVRRYCWKTDKDRPWVSAAIWQACWNFRKGLIVQFKALEQELDEAKRSQDPG